MAKKPEAKFPDLGNATEKFLIDEIAKLAKASARAKKLTSYYKTALRLKLPEFNIDEEFRGELFKLKRIRFPQERLDTKKTKAYLEGLGILSEYQTVTDVEQMRTAGIGEDFELFDPNDPFRGLLAEDDEE